MADDTSRREIQASLKSIVESSDSWLVRLRKREQQVRLASSFLTTILAFVIFAVSALIFLFAEGDLRGLGHPPPQVFPLIGLSALVSLGCGAVTYYFLKRKHEGELKDLSSLVSQMKKVDEGSIVGITEDALSLAEKILTILPIVVRKRSQDALLFGVVAFILGSIVFHNPLGGLIVALGVWLYFRHETGKIYEKEISKLAEQKKQFEQRKKEFIDTL